LQDYCHQPRRRRLLNNREALLSLQLRIDEDWTKTSRTDDDRMVGMAISNAYASISTDVNTRPHYAGKEIEDDRIELAQCWRPKKMIL